MTDTFQCPPGHVICTTYGSLRAETAFALLEARSFTEEQGIKHLRYQAVQGALVDKARNDAMRRMLNSDSQWLLFVDGDMVWEKDAFLRLLQAAYGTHSDLDVLGAYCSLRGDLCLPTIDTGTGTWESYYPGQGVVEVMRTGAAFLLVKRHVAERVPSPWFALRVPMRPLDAVAEVDTFCRTIFDGRNPFRNLPSGAWESLEAAATAHGSTQGPWVAEEVGEDSSFCDRVRNAGLRIGVQTDLVVQHLHTSAQSWPDHRKAMLEHDRQVRLASGLVA